MTTLTTVAPAGIRPRYFRRRRALFLIAWSALVMFQMLSWLSSSTLLAALLILAGGILGVSTLARPELMRAYPISSSMLLGYTASYFLMPPIVTLAEWKPVTNNLDHPVLVFVHAFLCLLFLLGAHLFYRRSALTKRLRVFVVCRIHRPLGFFRVPGNTQFLLLGALGLAAMAYQIFVVGSAREEALGADNKLMQAMYPLVYLPYCILVRPLLGDRTARTSLRWKLVLLGYTAMLLYVSMGNNSRASFLIGIASISLAYGYAMAIRLVPPRILRPRNVVLVALALVTLLGPVADLATSMVIVRTQRSDLPAEELIDATLATMHDTHAIAQQRRSDNTISFDWDEYYVDNLFMSRLSNPKFADESLELAMRQDASARHRLRVLEWQHLLSVIPRPVIEAFGLPVDKNLVSTSSGGDLMLFITTGDYDVLRGFRTGSIFGSGYALFGWFYPLVLALTAIVIFVLADAQTTRRAMPTPQGRPPQWIPLFNPLAIVTYFSWVFYLTSAATGVESFSGLSHFILRGWVEVLLVYVTTYWATHFLARVLGRAGR